MMPEKANLTVLQAEVERSVIGHVVPQIKPVIIESEGSDGNIFAACECCVFRSNFLIDQQFVWLTCKYSFCSNMFRYSTQSWHLTSSPISSQVN